MAFLICCYLLCLAAFLFMVLCRGFTSLTGGNWYQIRCERMIAELDAQAAEDEARGCYPDGTPLTASA